MENSQNRTFYNCDADDYSPSHNQTHIVFRCRIPDDHMWMMDCNLHDNTSGLPSCKKQSNSVKRDKVELYHFNTIEYDNSQSKDFRANHFNIITLPEFEDEVKERLRIMFTDRIGEDPDLPITLDITYRKTGMSISTNLGTTPAIRGTWVSEEDNVIQYPIAIVSYSRHNEYGKTHLLLTKCKIKHFLFVEPDEFDAYDEWYDPSYCDLMMSNENFSKQGMGSTPMRNYILDYFSKDHERVWMLDDNIKGYKRYYQGTKNLIESAVIFSHIEQYCKQYDNVGIASHNFNPYITEGDCRTCLVKNGKCYSSMLIPLHNKIRFRYKHQEDNLISMEYINAGYCNLCFNSVCYDKETSGRDKGGNAVNIYKVKEGDTDGDGYKERFDYLKSVLTILFMEGKLKLNTGKTVDDLLKRSTTMKSKKYHAKLDYSVLIGNDNEIVRNDYWYDQQHRHPATLILM